MNNTNLKAKLVGNYPRKDGEHKGKLFYVYDISGPEDEIKKYKDSPSQKKWPRVNSVTGAPQLHTMFLDPLSNTNPLYLKQDGNYTLDKSETNLTIGRLEALRNMAPELIPNYTNHISESAGWTAGKVSTSTANLIVPGAGEKEATGEGADLNNVK